MSASQKLEAAIMDAITTAMGEGMPNSVIACQVAAFVGSLTSFRPASESAADEALAAAVQRATDVFNAGRAKRIAQGQPAGVTIQ